MVLAAALRKAAKITNIFHIFPVSRDFFFLSLGIMLGLFFRPERCLVGTGVMMVAAVNAIPLMVGTLQQSVVLDEKTHASI